MADVEVGVGELLARARFRILGCTFACPARFTVVNADIIFELSIVVEDTVGLSI